MEKVMEHEKLCILLWEYGRFILRYLLYICE